MGAVDISILSLIFCFLLLLIPLALSYLLKLKIIKDTIISILRMVIQLSLIGIFLEYIFKLNNPFLNVGWFLLMITVASFTVTGRSDLNLKLFIIPIFSALIIANFLIVLFLNGVVVRLDNIFEAKYIIALGGMLLGNCLKSNVIGISHFYDSIKRNENRYLYTLSLGGTHIEVLLPYLRKSITLALKPTIASISVIGLVSLPGMMTGQMLGGSNPVVAIKYQMAIMVGIFVSVSISVGLTILFTVKFSFNSFGILKNNIFKKKKRKKKQGTHTKK